MPTSLVLTPQYTNGLALTALLKSNPRQRISHLFELLMNAFHTPPHVSHE